MAALTFNAAVQADNTHIVTKSTDDAIGSDAAAVIVDSTKSKIEVMAALQAAMRAVGREFAKVNSVADVPTSGTSTE